MADAPKDERQSEEQVEDREERVRQFALDRARAQDEHVWRPVVFEGMFAQEAFSEGKFMPLAVTQIMWTSLPWLPGIFNKVVPESYVAVDLNSDGYSAATVTCPCGALHEIEIGTVVDGGCDRFFAWFGKDVRVARLDTEADPPD